MSSFLATVKSVLVTIARSIGISTPEPKPRPRIVKKD
jgi:hypothetical protein